MFDTTHALDAVRAADVMHPGIHSCETDAPLHELAARMSSLRVHALAIRGDAALPLSIISDLDLVAAISCGDHHLLARDIAAEATVTVSSRRPLREVAQMMSEHGVTHLVVVDHQSNEPLGIVSSSDVLAAYASAATN